MNPRIAAIHLISPPRELFLWDYYLPIDFGGIGTFDLYGLAMRQLLSETISLLREDSTAAAYQGAEISLGAIFSELADCCRFHDGH